MKWISQRSSEPFLGVRIPPGAPPRVNYDSLRYRFIPLCYLNLSLRSSCSPSSPTTGSPGYPTRDSHCFARENGHLKAFSENVKISKLSSMFSSDKVARGGSFNPALPVEGGDASPINRIGSSVGRAEDS